MSSVSVDWVCFKMKADKKKKKKSGPQNSVFALHPHVYIDKQGHCSVRAGPVGAAVTTNHERGPEHRRTLRACTNSSAATGEKILNKSLNKLDSHGHKRSSVNNHCCASHSNSCAAIWLIVYCIRPLSAFCRSTELGRKVAISLDFAMESAIFKRLRFQELQHAAVTRNKTWTATEALSLMWVRGGDSETMLKALDWHRHRVVSCVFSLIPSKTRAEAEERSL